MENKELVFPIAFRSCDIKTPNQCLITLLCWKLRLAFLYWIWMCLLCLFLWLSFFHCCQTTVTKGRLGVRASQSSSRVSECLTFKLSLTSPVLIRSGCCLFMAVSPAGYLREGRMWGKCLKHTIKWTSNINEQTIKVVDLNSNSNHSLYGMHCSTILVASYFNF